MEEEIRKEAEKFLNQLKAESTKPKNIYEFETVVPNYILLPLKASMEELITKNKEQEKVIELMAEAIHDYEDWTDTVCNIVDCKNTPHCKAETKEQELNCIIDYFRKKAKGEQYE